MARSRLRAAPSGAASSWRPAAGAIIEVSEDDCWWEARVLGSKGSKVELKFRVSDEVKSLAFNGKKMRPCGWLKMAAAVASPAKKSPAKRR